MATSETVDSLTKHRRAARERLDEPERILPAQRRAVCPDSGPQAATANVPTQWGIRT